MSQNLLKDLNLDIPSPLGSSIPRSHGLLGIDNLPTINISQAQSHDEEPDNFNPDDIMAKICFPDNLAADVAALFLTKVNAFVLATPGVKPEEGEEEEEYAFVGNKKEIEQFINKFRTFEDIQYHPDLINFYLHLIKGQKQIKIDPFSKNDSQELLEIYDYAGISDEGLSKFLPNIRDRINFIYSLCIDLDNQKPESLSQPAKIFRQFVLQNLARIEEIQDAHKQSVELASFMKNMVFVDTKLQFKARQFMEFLGKLKFSKTVSMPVVLDDGIHCNLFDLNMSEPHKVMHSMDMSKNNQRIDLSNLTINGDFICGKTKIAIILPKQINGLLDLANYQFMSSVNRIPDGTITVNLSYAIQKFDELLRIEFSESVTEILLTRPLINAVIKDEEQLKAFQEFSKKYPNIQIWDSKHALSLQDAINVKNQPVQQKTKAPVEIPVVQKPVIPEKTAEWLTRKEILSLYKDEPFADTDGLDRFLKRAINSNINIKSEDRMVDGNVVSCVHIDCLALLKEAVSHVIEEDLKHTKQKPTQTVKTTEHKQEKDQKKQKKQKPVRFKKYIPKQIWKEICASCNDSYGLLYSVLQRINLINIDYTKQALSGAIQYLDENRQIQVIPTLQKKKGCALAQNIEDRTKGAVSRRIVWTMNPKDKIIIAIKFCADHTDTTTAVQTYKNARTNAAKCNNMNGEPVTRELINQNIDNYYDVADLLKQYKPKEKPVVDVQTKTEKPKTHAKVRVATPSLNTKEKPKATLVDMTSLEYKVRAMIETLTVEIEKKNYRFTKLKSTDAKLKVWEEIKVCLDRKKRLEQELREMTK